MKRTIDSSHVLAVFMLLVAIHSILVGICLIVSPVSFLEKLGFFMEEKFFAAQGGVFHIVVSIAYLMAATNRPEKKAFVIFSFSAKFIATLFLFAYYLFVSPVLLVLLSGIGDLIMGIVIFVLFRLVWKRVQ
ncbi:MAG TPA: hypothetical protein PKJ28_01965 [Bacteroidales bacterium]|nr:hypothetical protein [Bacteroidales bacterium]HPS73422.1 hypothetical protein [Bacteroidales bacterium]